MNQRAPRLLINSLIVGAMVNSGKVCFFGSASHNTIIYPRGRTAVTFSQDIEIHHHLILSDIYFDDIEIHAHLILVNLYIQVPTQVSTQELVCFQLGTECFE